MDLLSPYPYKLLLLPSPNHSIYHMCAFPQGLLWPVKPFTLGTNGPLVMCPWVRVSCICGFSVISSANFLLLWPACPYPPPLPFSGSRFKAVFEADPVITILRVLSRSKELCPRTQGTFLLVCKLSWKTFVTIIFVVLGFFFLTSSWFSALFGMVWGSWRSEVPLCNDEYCFSQEVTGKTPFYFMVTFLLLPTLIFYA